MVVRNKSGQLFILVMMMMMLFCRHPPLTFGHSSEESREIVIFDVTRVMGELLNSNTSSTTPAAANTSWLSNNGLLLLAQSGTIYYESDLSILDFFPSGFTKLVGSLEKKLGWKLGEERKGGAGGGVGGVNTLLLSFGIPGSGNFTKKKLAEKWDRYQVNMSSSSSSKFPVSVLLAGRRSDCNFPVDHREYLSYQHNLQRLFSLSDLPAISVEFTEMQVKTGCRLNYLNFGPAKLGRVAVYLEFVAGRRFPESYRIFKDHMDGVVRRTEQNAPSHRYSNNKALFRIQLRPPPPPPPPPTSTTNNNGADSSAEAENIRIHEAYTLLASRFAFKWASEEGHTVILELNRMTHQPHYYKGEMMTNDLIPTIENNVIPAFNSDIICPKSFNWSSIFPLVSQKFTTVSMDVDGFQAHCKPLAKSPGINSSSSSTNLMLYWRPSINSPIQFQEALTLQKTIFNQTVRTIVSSPEEISEISNIKFKGEGEASEIIITEFGCRLLYCRTTPCSAFAGGRATGIINIVERCELRKHSPQLNLVILEIRDPIDREFASGREGGGGGGGGILLDMFSPEFYMDNLQPWLHDVYNSATLLRQEFPSIRLLLQFPPQLSSGFERNPEVIPDAFCNPKILKLNTVVEAIVSWSYFHNISVVLKDVVNSRGFYRWDGFYSGWWDPIQVPEAGMEMYSSVYLMRNYPETMGSYLKIDPCLSRFSRALPKEVIPLERDRMGVSISTLGLLTPAELQTQLQYALHKFSNVEIQCGRKCDNIIQSDDVIIRALENVHLSKPTNHHHQKPPQIFIDFSFENVKASLLPKVLDNLASVGARFGTSSIGKFVRIQISNWEYNYQRNPEFLKLVQEMSQRDDRHVGVGLVTQKCNEVLWKEAAFADNHILMTRTSFTHFVCVQKNWEIQYTFDERDRDNYWKTMSAHLDAQYAIKVTLNRMFPGKEVHFRFDIQAPAPDYYLRAVRDVNEHAKLYNMSYFGIRGFGTRVVWSKDRSSRGDFKTDDKDDDILGWWNVAKDTDLANVSNYVEVESEYLEVATWRPLQYIFSEGKSSSTTSWWIILISVSVPTVGLIGALGVVWKLSRRRVLSRTEELEFLEGLSGSGVDNNNPSTTTENYDYLRQRFDPGFEIPKVNFNSDTNPILGMGNFGMVYKALVKGAWVAVKVPQEGGKNSFKSTLQEVKILCYVGSHENVVGFVGAYIKEIWRGTIQIATELCQNGTLLSHLRALSRTVAGIRGDGSSSSPTSPSVVSSFGLERFCLEIAAGMEYLSSKQVIHGDLATRNVLLDEHFTCKIADFGLSRKLYEYGKYVKESQEPLPWRWMAVESLKRMEFSSKSDVWSFGVTLWEIYSLGDVPYPGLSWTVNFVDELGSGLRLQQPQFSTDEMYARLLTTWNIDAELRPSFSELREFFQSTRNTQYISLDG